MFKNYCFTYCVVEMRVGITWYRIKDTASKGEARLTARLLSYQYPLHAVRIREVQYGK